MWKSIIFMILIISCSSGHAKSNEVNAGALQIAEKEDDQRGRPDWQDLGPAQQQAAAQGKMIMIFFEAEWCGICRRMEREVFADADVLQQLHSSFVSVMINVDSKSPLRSNGKEISVRQLAQQFNVTAVPTLLFVDEEGDVLAHQTGFVPVERMEALLAFINSDAFGRKSFEEYMDQ